MISDLKESEQYADMIMFLYRDEYYNPESEKKNSVECIIAKSGKYPPATPEALNLVGMVSLHKIRDIPISVFPLSIVLFGICEL